MERNLSLSEEYAVVSYQSSVVDIPLKDTMHLAFGNIESRPSGIALIEGSIHSSEAALGLGEGVTLPLPVFTDDSGTNIKQNISDLIKNAVLPNSGKPMDEIVDAVSAYSFSDEGRYPTARLATEMALLDSYSKACQTSIASMIGVSDIDEVPYGKSIGGLTKNEILHQAEESLNQNAKKIKLKVTPFNFNDVAFSIKELKRRHPELDLMVDANGGFDPENSEHIKMLNELDSCSLMMIEEPVSRNGAVKGLDAVRLLRDKKFTFITPICLDDCLIDYETCTAVLNEELADIINIKPGRIGSFVSSLALIDYCSENNKQVMVGGMFEATPGRALTVSLGAYCLKKGFRIPGDLSLAQERLNGDLVNAEHQLKLGPKGGILVPRGNGWGYDG